MADPPPTGTLLFATLGVDRTALAAMNALDASDAAALTLAEYLKAAVFRVAGLPEQRFRLKDAIVGWPENFHELEYPTASITAPSVSEEAHSFTPTPLEETLDLYCPGTVLWKTSEEGIRFQVDFWVTDRRERRAISAALGALFAPTEGRYGVMLQGPPEYWSLPIRYTLLSYERLDSSEDVQARQRRLRAEVQADVDVVHLRKAVRFDPRFWVNGEPVPLEPTGGT